MKVLGFVAALSLLCPAAFAAKGQQQRVSGHEAASRFFEQDEALFAGAIKSASVKVRHQLDKLRRVGDRLLRGSKHVDIWSKGDTTWYRSPDGTIKVSDRAVVIRPHTSLIFKGTLTGRLNAGEVTVSDRPDPTDNESPAVHTWTERGGKGVHTRTGLKAGKADKRSRSRTRYELAPTDPS
jgi:hypothetical protein